VTCQIGKTTNRTKSHPPSPTTKQPGDLVHADIFYVRRGKKRKSAFLIAVDDMTGHLSTFRLTDKRPTTLDSAVTKLAASYAALGIRIRKVRCHHEAVFRAIETEINTRGIELQLARPGQHSKTAERATQTLKERHRCAILGHQYRMPSSLWDFAVGHATKAINMVPNTKCWPRPPNEVNGRDKPTFDVDTDAFFGKVAFTKNLGIVKKSFDAYEYLFCNNDKTFINAFNIGDDVYFHMYEDVIISKIRYAKYGNRKPYL
jgi:hypothetical protein